MIDSSDARSRLRAATWALLAAAALACADAPDPDGVTIDLSAIVAEAAPERVAVSPGRIVLPPQGRLALAVRLPTGSRLRFGVEPEAAARQLGISATTASSNERLSPTADGEGAFVVPLASLDGETVVLGVRNGGPGEIAWIAPRIEGFDLGEATLVEPPAPFAPTAERWNVLLYVVDTLRADRLGLYGYTRRPTSPKLDALGDRAIVFDRAYAASSHTAPSIAALFTGLQPSAVSGRLADRDRIGTTLAEAFAAAGWQTAAIQSNPQLIEGTGYERGFAHYVLARPVDAASHPLARADALRRESVAWLSAADREPFFLYVQSMDVHIPYAPPEPFYGTFVSPEQEAKFIARRIAKSTRTDATKEGLAEEARTANPGRYDEAILYTDHEIALLLEELDRLGVRERTIVVVTSDHGEPLLQRGTLLHGQSLHEELVHVPLLILLPGVDAGLRVPDVVSLTDLGATLLDLAGAGTPARPAGTSWLEAQGRLSPRTAVGELLWFRSHDIDTWFIREGPWKLIVNKRDRAYLFDLESDPGEQRNVARDHPVTLAWLRSQLELRSPSLGASAIQPAPLTEGLTPERQREIEEALEVLGYVEP